MQRLLIAALTVLVFGAGYAARLWTERDRPVPPPPGALGIEFVRPAAPQPADAKDGKFAGPNRARLIKDIERFRPGIDAYRKRLTELDAEFEHALMAVLSPEQREKFTARLKGDKKGRPPETKEFADMPLSDERILQLQQIPLFNALWSITISARVERLKDSLKLDRAQEAKARDLMLARREKFLALVDSLPPPTVSLSLLARRTDMLAEPAPAK